MASHCGPNQFTCDNVCLELSRKCDKIRDCLDRSDEENCGYSSSVVSDFDRIAQLGLFIGIGVIGFVLLVILIAVFIICMRRSKRRQLASVQVIQVPSHYIKTHDAHSSVGSTASAVSCSSAYRVGPQQLRGSVDGQCGYFGSEGNPVVTTVSSSTSSNALRSHRSSRRSTRSRRSTSSGEGRRRHVPRNNNNDNGCAVTQPSSAFAVSGDSGIAAESTIVPASATFGVGRPSSVHSSLHHGRREGMPAIPAAFRHSFHGHLDEVQLQQQQQQQQQQQRRLNNSNNNLQDSVLTAAVPASSLGTLDTSPPPPYSTFDRTVVVGRFDSAVSNEPNVIVQQQNQQSTALLNATDSSNAIFMSQRPNALSNSTVDHLGVRSYNSNSVLLREERNIIYGETAAVSPGHMLPNSFASSNRPGIIQQNRLSAVEQSQEAILAASPSADYTRLWIERVASADSTAVLPTAIPAASSVEDTFVNEQSYAQQIRLALRKNQRATPTISETRSRLVNDVLESPCSVNPSVNVGQTPQSLASGYLNVSSSTRFTATPSPTRCDQSSVALISRHQNSQNNFRPAYHAPVAIISKRPMPLNI